MEYKNVLMNLSASSSCLQTVTSSSWDKCFSHPTAGGHSYILEQLSASGSQPTLYSKCGFADSVGYFKKIKIKDGDIFISKDKTTIKTVTVSEFVSFVTSAS